MYQAQSYYSVILKGQFSVYEMRILLKIVQRTRFITKHRGAYKDYLQKEFSMDGFNLNYAISVSELIGKSHNYNLIKEAARHLERDWQVEYYDRETKTWHLTSMIYNVQLEERTGILRFSCAKWLIDYITDFRNGGYREYDFETAMSMRNPNAARLYLLVCSQTTPRNFDINQLKEILGVSGKYPRLHDFIRRCIDPAMKELEQRGANGFKYEILRQYKDKPRSTPRALRLLPVKREKKSVNISEQIKDFRSSVPSLLSQYLVQQWHFTNKELLSNSETLKAFTSLPSWQYDFIDISDRARRKGKGHGYLIAAMKSVVKEKGASPPGAAPLENRKDNS